MPYSGLDTWKQRQTPRFPVLMGFTTIQNRVDEEKDEKSTHEKGKGRGEEEKKLKFYKDCINQGFAEE